jgi:hypothetical protein
VSFPPRKPEVILTKTLRKVCARYIFVFCLFKTSYMASKLVFATSYYAIANDSIFVVIVMVFNATFNNISVKSWMSVLLVEETGVPRENHP